MSESTKVLIAILAPWVLYGMVWLVGRAYHAGKLSAIRSAFNLGRKK